MANGDGAAERDADIDHNQVIADTDCLLVFDRDRPVSPDGCASSMVCTLDLTRWAGRWVAVDSSDRVLRDAPSLADLLAILADAPVGDVEVMHPPAPDAPVVDGLG